MGRMSRPYISRYASKKVCVSNWALCILRVKLAREIDRLSNISTGMKGGQQRNETDIDQILPTTTRVVYQAEHLYATGRLLDAVVLLVRLLVSAP